MRSFSIKSLLAIAFSMGSFANAGEIAHWRMDVVKESKVEDLSGNGNDGLVVGNVEFVEGDYGKALYFDGSTYIKCGNNEQLNLTNDFCVELWLKADEFVTGEYVSILSKYGEGPNGWLLYRPGWDRYPNIWFRAEGSSRFNTRFKAGHLVGQWRYIAINHTSGKLVVYVDGRKVLAKDVQGHILKNEYPLLIGALTEKQKAGKYFKGAIREIIIHGKGLSQKQIWRKSLANRKAISKVVDVPESMYVTSKTGADDRTYAEWVRTMRSVDWRIPPEITLEQARSIVNHLNSQGFDTLFVGGWHRYMFAEEYGQRNWWSAIPWKVYLRSMKIVKQACQEADVKLVIHLTAHLALFDDYERVFKGMATCDVDTGKPYRWERYFGYPLCPNNTDFRKVYTERLKELIGTIDFDGVMIDETGFGPNNVGPRTCGCMYCKALFKKRYGYELPKTKDKKVWGNYSSPQWKAWLNFRIESIDEWFGQLSAVIKQDGAERLFTSCYCNPLGVSVPSSVGIEPETKMNNLDVFFYECEPLTPWSWRHVIAEGKYVNAIGPIILFNPCASVSQQYFSRILGMAHGWLGHQWPEFNNHRTVPVLWEKKWQKLWLGNSSMSNVAIVFSSSARSLTGKYLSPSGTNDMDEYVGWAQTLLENHIPFDVLLTEQLSDQKLRKYDTVILPDAACLSQSQAEVIRSYVKNGGKLIATDESSLYDDAGAKLPGFALADVMGVQHVGNIISGTIVSKSKDLHFDTMEYPTVMCKIKRTSADELAVDKKSGHPLIVLNHFGKGSCLYYAFSPGKMYRMPKVGVGWYGEGGYWCDDRKPEYADLMARAVKSYNEGILKTENVPVEIIVNPVTLRYKGYAATMIHLVNGLGTRFKRDVVVPTNKDYDFTEYPSVKKFIPEGKQMTFWVKVDDVRNVYLVSPDFCEVVQLDYEMNEEGFCKVAVPDIGRYEIIYIQQSKKNLILEEEKRIVRKLPSFKPFKVLLTSER